MFAENSEAEVVQSNSLFFKHFICPMSQRPSVVSDSAPETLRREGLILQPFIGNGAAACIRFGGELCVEIGHGSVVESVLRRFTKLLPILRSFFAPNALSPIKSRGSNLQRRSRPALCTAWLFAVTARWRCWGMWGVECERPANYIVASVTNAGNTAIFSSLTITVSIE